MSRPVRRSQAIAPFGIGALVDFPGPVSLVHAGLDAWPFDEGNPDHHEFRFIEKRLARRLGVDFFVQPPDFRKPRKGMAAAQPNLNLRLPFLRFPLWHVCPRCGRMHLARYQDVSAPSCKGPVGSGAGRGGEHSSRKTIQVRFVAACKSGHLQDFPWLEWLFQQPDPEWQPDGSTRWLRMRSTGSASLTGVEVTAEQREANGDIRIVARKTLGKAFEGDPVSGSQSAFTKIGVKCEGHNPVLAVGKNSPAPLPGCGQEIYPLLRGASNLYFPHVVSSIYIPDVDARELPAEVLDLLDDDRLRQSLLHRAQDSDNGLVSVKVARNALREFFPESSVDAAILAEAANKYMLQDVLLGNSIVRRYLSQRIKTSPDNKLTKEIVDEAIENYCPDWEIDTSLILPALSKALQEGEGEKEQEEPRQDSLLETDYRREEYQVFCRDGEEGYPKTNLLIKSSDIKDYGPLVRSSFERISLLHKMRETRAYVGYSRIFPENSLETEERWKLIALEKKRWLPAVIVRGEGIFLKFSEEKLNAWLAEHGTFHEGRLSTINRNLDELRARRHQPTKLITPKHVLIHTFAHLLINQLVYECGYGSASLRERIYTSEGENSMSGVLIYTAAGDSEGTMGGLVRMGQSDCLDATIARALERASWCSSDPVCIESPGQGPDNCNLGACHSCALLPETSCEEQNRLLDRGIVIGTIERPASGYFSDQV